VDNAIMIHP